MDQPPKWANRFLEWYCHPRLLEDLQGDLFEIYRITLKTEGKSRADFTFVWLVIRSLRWSAIKDSKSLRLTTLDMYNNYLKIALRFLLGSKLYTSINVTGLAVGMAVFMLIFLYVRDELGYDSYHTKSDSIYRVVSNLTTPDSYFEFAVSPPQLGPNLKKDFPEVIEQLRIVKSEGVPKIGEKIFRDDVGVYSEPSFFSLFDIPILEKNRETPLSEPYTIVLTESAARKYFGDKSAVGNAMEIVGIDQTFLVVAIMQDVPSNSHFSFDYLISISTRESLGYLKEGQWFNLDYYTYLLLPENHSVKELVAKLPDFIENHIGEIQRNAGQSYEFEIQRLTDIHLTSHRMVELGANGNIQYIYIYSLIAIFVLIIACVNFINLSTARASKRAKEIGLRKVVGAVRTQLVSQFLLESTLISVFSFILAVILTTISLTFYNGIIDKDLSIRILFEAQTLLFWIALVFISGFLAGIYPAIVLSRYKPIRALKSGTTTNFDYTYLRKGLVVFQLVISTILIMGTIVINTQLQRMQNQNLGFDREQILTINFDGDETVLGKMDELRSEFLKISNVTNAAFSRFTPSTEVGNWYTMYEGTPGETHNASMYGYLVDYNFIDTYGLQILVGRGFDRTIASDIDEAYIINETAARKIGFINYQDAIDKPINQLGKDGKIVAVVKDFNFRSLHNEIEPLVLQLAPRTLSIMSVKLSSGNVLETINDLKETWSSIVPSVPFEVAFLDQDLTRRYSSEIRTSNVFTIFSGLAIFIASLGLFALSTLSAEQQRKSISVRKVLGATQREVIYDFTLQFFKLSCLALIISIPATYLLAEAWLKDFPYRIDVGFSIFLLGGLATIFVTIITVSYQSFRLSKLNPVQNLRSES